VTSGPAIALTYGTSQRFRGRCADITIPGRVAASMPLAQAVWRLNDGPPVDFYVERAPDDGVDWRFAYKASPARLRLPRLGDFTIEIAVDHPELRDGANRLAVDVEDGRGRVGRLEAVFAWDPRPVPLPLDLRDLSRFDDIQEIGQVVNGAFDLDRAANVIRARAPVAPDALLVLGSPHGSQEATYDVRFSDLERAKYLGLSDFFVRHEAEEPPIGIKPGWSTAGLATLTYGWRPGSPGEGRPAARAGTGAAGRGAGLARLERQLAPVRPLARADGPAGAAPHCGGHHVPRTARGALRGRRQSRPVQDMAGRGPRARGVALRGRRCRRSPGPSPVLPGVLRALPAHRRCHGVVTDPRRGAGPGRPWGDMS